MNATLQKFGFPATTLVEYHEWILLLRPQQVTLGSMVLAAKSDVTSLGALKPAAFTELGVIIPQLELALKKFKPYQRINYLTLMMVDPHVHSHIIPRYATDQSFGDIQFTDKGWPGLPDLKSFTTVDPDSFSELQQWLQKILSSEARD